MLVFCKVIVIRPVYLKNSQLTSGKFASVLFDFDLRERLVKQTDAKLLTIELTILQVDCSLVLV